MARETAKYREEQFRKVERACNAAGLKTEREGTVLAVRVSEERRWLLRGGGGIGVLRCEVEVNGEPEAVVVMTTDKIIARLQAVA